MKISATINNELNSNRISVSTNDQVKGISIQSKAGGFGSAINGGELLLLSLAVCYCNDIYREATKRNMTVTAVEVEVTGEFGAEGEAGTNFRYKPLVKSNATPQELQALIEHTDRVAEIHKTLRAGVSIDLVR